MDSLDGEDRARSKSKILPRSYKSLLYEYMYIIIAELSYRILVVHKCDNHFERFLCRRSLSNSGF